MDANELMRLTPKKTTGKSPILVIGCHLSHVSHILQIMPGNGILSFIILLLILGAVPLRAQSATLELVTAVEGHIEPGLAQAWTFSAREGTVLSFIVEATSGDLDPLLMIQSNTGTPLITNDDYNYPDSQNALLEAMTIPRNGTYNVSVSGLAGSSGDYSLTMLPGFAQVAVTENFNDAESWPATAPLTAQIGDSQLTLALAGVQQTGIIQRPGELISQDFYARVRVANVTGRTGWMVGMTIRQQDEQNYHLVEVNQQGFWRFLTQTSDSLRVVRDWITHPAIVPGETAFTLGVLANGTAFDIFYNEQFIGQVIDTSFDNAGTIGLMVATTDALTAETAAQFDDLIITVPLEIDGQPIFPQQLTLGGSPTSTVQELQRRRLIPTGGKIVLTVPESSAQSIRPGVSRFLLGRGTTYTDFVLGTTITWQITGPGPAGCGLVLRALDDTHYTLAYIDQTGGYGLSQRDGEEFQPGIFGQKPGWEGEAHALIVIAQGDQLYYYIDGQYAGTLENPVVDGEIGNAVVNFEAIDTSCRFDDTWLWDWE
jgi:hypothetical protein